MFSQGKSFWPIIPRIIECQKLQGSIFNAPQAFLTVTVEFIRSLSWDLRGCWKHKFSKKINPCDEEKFSPTFPRKIECGKHHGAIDNCPKGILAKTVSYNIISVLPNWLLKTENFERKGNLSKKEKLWLSFSVLSSVTNLKQQFIRVQKLFWQLLWKVLDHFRWT